MQQLRHSRLAGIVLFIVLLLVVSSALVLVGLPFDIRTQVVFSAFIFAVCFLVGQSRSEGAKMVLVFLTLLVSTRYIWWRATSTLAFDDPFSAMAGYTLFAAEIYAYFVLLLGYVQTIRPLRRKPVPLPENEAHWPTVDVFIPTYNEPLDVVATTIAGVRNLEYPLNKLNIYLLDDGNRTEFKRYAAQAGVYYRSRSSNKGAKAGNINEAIKHTKGDLIAIFDCDQIPVRSFLQVAAGWFLKDEKLAQLQTPQFFYTPDPMEKNLETENKVPNESSLFYGLIQDGNDLWNATFFCGSCAVLRRSAVEDIGGIAEETVTEDAHTSLKLHRKGYTSAYLNAVQSAGLATESLSDHINQRIRWARGLAQIFRVDNPFLGRGLSFFQRLCYANATMHFLYAAPRLIFLIAPLFFLFFDLSIIHSEAIMVAAMALPHILQNNLTSAKISGHWRHAFWAEVYETVLSFYIFMPTLVALIMPSRGKFNVTEKGKSSSSSYYAYSLARPILALGFLNAAAMGLGLYGLYTDEQSNSHTTVLNLVWASYNFVIIGVALGVAREIKQSRGSKRHPVSLSAVLTTSSGRRVLAEVKNLSTTGVCVAMNPDYINSDAYHSDKPFHRISFECGTGLKTFTVERVSKTSSLLTFRITSSGFEQLRSLVSVLYSPADRWHSAREEQKEVGVLKCLLKIVFIGLSGWRHAIQGMVSAVFSAKESKLESITNQAGTAAGVLGFIVLSLFLILKPSVSEAQSTRTDMTYEIRSLTEKTESPIDLGTVNYATHIPFAIRRDVVVNSGEIILNLSWSDKSADKDRVLRILLNGRVLWSATEITGERVALRLPFDGIRLSDYNSLSFSLDRKNESECFASAGDSFEVVIHDESRIEMDITSIPIANDLDTLPLPFFDDRDPRRVVINFVMPDNPSSNTLLAAGRTAAWFGALASYRGVEFQVTKNELPADNAIVVATGPDLPSELSWLDAGEPRVLLVDSPDGSDHQMLVLTAPDESGLQEAVNSLLESVSSDNLEGYFAADRPPSDRDRLNANRWIDPRVPVSLSSLVDSDEVLQIQGNNFAPISIPFEVPGDFTAAEGVSHKLVLDYHYYPDFPDYDEKMHVSLNGAELHSIDIASYTDRFPLQVLAGGQSESGGFKGTLEVEVPADLIRSSNSLDIRFSAPSEVSSNCQAAASVQVDAGIDGGSMLDLSKGVLRGRYPDLSLFVNAGLPFTQFADLRQTHIELAENADTFQYALYLNLMGRFAAITGTEPGGVSVATGPVQSSRKHRILITGSRNHSRMNSELSRSPLSFSKAGIQANFDHWRSFYTAVSDWVNPLKVEHELSRLKRPGQTDHQGYILSARSVITDDGMTLILVADTENSGSAIQLTLTDPKRLSDVRGSAVVADQNKSVSIQTGRDLTSGKFSLPDRIMWWLSENVFAAILFACFLAIVFAFAMPVTLDRVAYRRLQ